MEHLSPMLARAGTMPVNETGWSFEIKWDGIRALFDHRNGKSRIISRNLKDLTAQYPELTGLGSSFGLRDVVLDGEIVAFEETGRPSFSLLQHRMGRRSPEIIQRLTQTIPVVYVVFDLLFLDGESVMELPYHVRRALLEELPLAGPYWQLSAIWRGRGYDLREATLRMGLEGIIAKRIDSPYLPGKRTGDWIKVKNVQRQELIICGWLPGERARRNTIGALITGYYDRPRNLRTSEPRRLIHAGNAGTGFTRQMLADLLNRLASLAPAENPFSPDPGFSAAHYVRPELVAEFEFTEWTPQGTMRHPSFKGLRADKDPEDVVRENFSQDYSKRGARHAKTHLGRSVELRPRQCSREAIQCGSQENH